MLSIVCDGQSLYMRQDSVVMILLERAFRYIYCIVPLVRYLEP